MLDGMVMREEDVFIEPSDDPVDVVQHILQRPRLTHYQYTSVELLSDSPSTIVPLEQFQRDDVPSLYKLNFPQTTARRTDICYEMVPSLEVVVLYSLDMDVRNAVTDMYPEAQVSSVQAQYLNRAYDMSLKGDTSRVEFFAFVERRQMHLCTFLLGQLQFACNYETQVDEDRAYYLLAVWKTLQLDGEVDVCNIAGASPELVEQLSRFIRKVQRCE